MTRTRRRLAVVVAGAGAVAAAARLYQAVSGTVPPSQAGAEILAGLLAVGLIALTAHYWSLDRRAGLTQAVVTAVAGGALLLPLWINAHPPPPLFEGVLGGATREGTSRPAPTSGTYLLAIAPSGEAWTGDYRLQVRTGAERTTFRRTMMGGRQREAIDLDEGDRLTIFAERSDGPLAVRLHRAPLRRGIVLLAMALAVLVAAAGERLTARSARPIAGASTALVAFGGIFAALYDPSDLPGGRAVIGGLLGAAVAGGLAGAIWGAVLRHLLRRS